MAVRRQETSGLQRATVTLIVVVLFCALWTEAASVQSFLIVAVGFGTVLLARYSALGVSQFALDPQTPRTAALARVAKSIVASFAWPAAAAGFAVSLSGTIHAPDIDFLTALAFFGVLGTAPFLWFFRGAIRRG